MSPDEVQAAALYLNNLGVIVHFRESISTRDVVIIDPQFLTKVRRTNARMRPCSRDDGGGGRVVGGGQALTVRACVRTLPPAPPRTPVATICR